MAASVEFVDGERSWDEMLPDALYGIFQRLPLEDMFRTVPLVCSSWRKASLDPRLWESIDLCQWFEVFAFSREKAYGMVTLAVDRSCGRLQELSIPAYGTDAMLTYIAERCNSVKCLRFSYSDLTDFGICKVANRLPLLEEFVINGCDNLSKLAMEALGQECISLRWLEWNGSGNCVTGAGPLQSDEAAHAIAKNMPQLRHLEMAKSLISNEGLLALLEGCQNLEHLDLRRCGNLVEEASIMQNCSRIKKFLISYEFQEEYQDYLYFLNDG